MTGNTATFTGDITNAGRFFAGEASDQKFTVAGRFAQTADGELYTALRKHLPGAPMIVDGPAVDLAGTVRIAVESPETLHVGDRYLLIDTDAPVNVTATLILNEPAYRAEPLVVAGEGLYALITAVPEPGCTAAIGLCAPLLLRRRR